MNKRQKEVHQAFLDNEKEVLEMLEDNYKDAIAEIDEKIALLLGRQDADMQNVIYQVEYQKALKGHVEGILTQLQSNEFQTVSQYLQKAYEDGFIGAMYDMQGQGVPLVIPINQEAVVAAIQHETKLSEDLYTALGKDTKRLSKQIAAEISRGISNNATYEEITRNIASFSNIPMNNAARIARTEAHRIQCKATADAQFRAKEKGADVVKQWDSFLDGKTRSSHRHLDGQIRELEEPFEVNGKEAMQPGGFGDPAEDINCRCALLQRARWAVGNDFTKWDREQGGIVEIRAKDYDSFKMQYEKESQRVRSNAQKKNDEEAPKKTDVKLKENTSNDIIKVEEPVLIDDRSFKHATSADYSKMAKEHSKNVTKQDREQIHGHKKEDGLPGGYVATHNYSNINSNLRSDGFTLNKLDADDFETIEALRRAIKQNTLDDDYVLTRYVNADYLSSVFGIKTRIYKNAELETIGNSITKISNPYVVNEGIPTITKELQALVGSKIPPDKAFLSTSLLSDKNIMQDKAVLFEIHAPKGTNAYIPKNRKESECILGENTSLYIENVEFNSMARKWIITARVL